MRPPGDGFGPTVVSALEGRYQLRVKIDKEKDLMLVLSESHVNRTNQNGV